MGGISILINITLSDLIGQYSLLAIPLSFLAIMYLLMHLNMSER